MKYHCLFCHLSDELKDSFTANVRKWKYHSGRYIYRQNDVSTSLYFIKDGGVYFEVYCDIIKTLS
jgi:CRP-like cAMP-binding protein